MPKRAESRVASIFAAAAVALSLAGCGITGPGRSVSPPPEQACVDDVTKAAKRIGAAYVPVIMNNGTWITDSTSLAGRVALACENSGTLSEAKHCFGLIDRFYKSTKTPRPYIPATYERALHQANAAFQVQRNGREMCLPELAQKLSGPN